MTKKKKKNAFSFSVKMVWYHKFADGPHWQFELLLSPYSGDACWDEVYWWTLCYKDPEEGCGHPGWWRWMHHGGKTSSSSAGQTSIPHPSPLLLSDCGEELCPCIIIYALGGQVYIALKRKPLLTSHFVCGLNGNPTNGTHIPNIRLSESEFLRRIEYLQKSFIIFVCLSLVCVWQLKYTFTVIPKGI